MTGVRALLLATLLPAGVTAAPQYLSPTAVAVDEAGKTLYVAELTANRVAKIDLVTGGIRHYLVSSPPTGVALSPDRATLFVTGASPEGELYYLDPDSGAVEREVAVGHTPSSPVVSPDGRFVYISNQLSGTVSVVEASTGARHSNIGSFREPAGLALSPDGNTLLVANLLPAFPSNADYVAATVSVVDTVSRKPVGEIKLPNGSNAVRDVCFSPDGRYAYAVHILSHFQLPTTQLERGWMNTNVLSIIDVATRRLVNTVILDELDAGAANPWAVQCTKDGRQLLVAHAGTHEISVIDRKGLHSRLDKAAAGTFRIAAEQVPEDFLFLNEIRERRKLPGQGPRDLAIAGDTVYAPAYFSDSVAVLALGDDAAATSLPLGPERSLTLERRGELLFHDASACFQQWQSCASCHPTHSRPDGLNWDLLNDGIGNPKNTKNLLLAHETPPAMISGVRDRAETAVRSGFKFILFAQVPEAAAAAVDAYLKSLEPEPSPFLNGSKLSPAAERGKEIFRAAKCADCHNGPYYTDLKQHVVGTGGRFDTPTLIEVWRTAPYLNDGRSRTMQEMLTRDNAGDDHGVTSNLTTDEIEDLAEFVLSL